METLQELKDAIAANRMLLWNDPDPIEGNDYLISEVFGLDELEEFSDEELKDCPILIHYGEYKEGNSEAEVLLSEIGYVTERRYFVVNDGLADVNEMICQNLYEEGGPSKVYDYCNKVNMPYSHCGPCEADTPTIVRRETDTCAVCGGKKEIQENY